MARARAELMGRARPKGSLGSAPPTASIADLKQLHLAKELPNEIHTIQTQDEVKDIKKDVTGFLAPMNELAVAGKRPV